MSNLANHLFPTPSTPCISDNPSCLQKTPSTLEVKLEGEFAPLTEWAIAVTVQLEANEAGVDWFDLRVVLNVADTKLTQAEIKLLLSAIRLDEEQKAAEPVAI